MENCPYGLDYFVMLLLGLAVAISPIPLLVLALILVSPRRRINGPAFLAGWVGGLVLVCILASLFAGALEAAFGMALPVWTLLVKLGIGVGFIFMGYKAWQDAQNKDSTHQLPALASGLDSIGPGRAFALAGFLGVVGVKNPLLCLAAALFMAASGLGSGFGAYWAGCSSWPPPPSSMPSRFSMRFWAGRRPCSG